MPKSEEAEHGARDRGGGSPVQALADDKVRLSVNLSPMVAEDLSSYAKRKGISVTEAVRRAIGVLKYIDQAQDRGASMNIEENGALKEIQFLV